MTKIHYVKYKTATGEVTGHGYGTQSLMTKRVNADESYLVVDDTEGVENKKVVSGALVDLTSSEISSRDSNEHWRELRYNRDLLLSASDWRLLEDSGTTNKEEWKTYRQALRDLPANTTDPTNVTWPTKPS